MSRIWSSAFRRPTSLGGRHERRRTARTGCGDAKADQAGGHVLLNVGGQDGRLKLTGPPNQHAVQREHASPVRVTGRERRQLEGEADAARAMSRRDKRYRMLKVSDNRLTSSRECLLSMSMARIHIVETKLRGTSPLSVGAYPCLPALSLDERQAARREAGNTGSTDARW
jgi:hypothetical protein